MRSSFLRHIRDIDYTHDQDNINDVDLDIGRPILHLDKMRPEKQLATQIRIIDQIVESDDSLVLSKLLSNGLLSLLNQAASLNLENGDIRIAIFDIMSKISSGIVQNFIYFYLN